MVSSIYTPNRKIDYYRKLAQALQPKKMMAFDPRLAAQNPYAQTTGTSLANVLSNLVETYSAQQQFGKAERLEAEQLAAQRAIGGQLAQMRTPGTGSTLDIQEAVPAQRVGEHLEGRVINVLPSVSRRPFSMDAPQFTPEQIAAAGTTPELLQGRIAEIRTGRKEAYTARQEAEIDRRLESITVAIAITGEGPERERLQNQRSQLLAIKDAAQTAVRQETQERTRAKEARGVAEKIAAAKRTRVDVYNVKSEKKDRITQEQMDLDQARTTPKYEYEQPATGRVGFVHFVPTTGFSAGGINYLEGQRYQVTQENIRADAELRKAVETQSRVVKPEQLEKQATEVAELPARPVISGAEMARRIEEASAGDLPGIVKSAVDGVMSFFTLDDVFPETREAKAALDEMRMTMRVPLVKALSTRGGKFTIQQVDKVLPSSGLSDAANMARIRALIDTYKETLNEANRIYKNQPVGSEYYVAAEKTIYTIMSLLPELQEMVGAWDNRNQGNQATPEGIIRLPSGIKVKKLSGRSSRSSTRPTVPTGG